MRANRPTGRRLGPKFADRHRPAMDSWLGPDVALSSHALLPSGRAGGNVGQHRFELDAVGSSLREPEVDLTEIFQ